MAMNRIQFQPGLSLTDFLEQYGTEERCEQALSRPAGQRVTAVSTAPVRTTVS